MRNDFTPYDAIVLLSFGGPESAEEVVPFLERVTAGRNIPRERLVEVGEHYFARGGVSPINQLCRDLLDALRGELDGRGAGDLPMYWGNRNSEPFLPDTLARVAADGHRRVAVVTTSAYPSYSSCRQYRENLAAALPSDSEADDAGLQVDRIRQYANHPGFVTANADRVLAALDELPRPSESHGSDLQGDPHGSETEPTRLVFVTHSIPTQMAITSGPDHAANAVGESADDQEDDQEGAYGRWHRDVAEAIAGIVAERTGQRPDWDLTYCSRSGSPRTPWLEPDVNDHLETLAQQGIRRVVLAPIGFTSDHMEVVHDLDTEALATAERVGITAVRAGTAGTHPDFVAALVDLVAERAAVARGEQPDVEVVDGTSPGLWTCPGTCCPNTRHPQTPTLCGPTP